MADVGRNGRHDRAGDGTDGVNRWREEEPESERCRARSGAHHIGDVRDHHCYLVYGRPGGGNGVAEESEGESV